MNGVEEGRGVPIGNTGIVLYGPEFLGPPKTVSREESFPIGDFQRWVGYYIPVYGISCESFLDVYLQLNGEETNMVLDKVADYVERVPTVTKTTTEFPKTPGSPCLALFEDDNWYRARIMEDLGDDVYQVYFVDYGNSLKVKADKLMHCPNDLVDFVEGVSHVALHGFTGDESKDEIEALSKFVVETDLIAKIESSSFEIKGKTRMLVNLFTAEGQPIRSLVEEEMKNRRALPIQDEPVSASEPLKLREEVFKRDEEVLSDSSPCGSGTEDKPDENPPVLTPAESDVEVPVTLEPELTCGTEVTLSVVHISVPPETPENDNIIGTEIPSSKIQMVEQFEDAVDSGLVTIPRKPSITLASPVPATSDSVVNAEKLEEKYREDRDTWGTEKRNLERRITELEQNLNESTFLKKTEALKTNKLLLEKQIENLHRELATKEQVIAEYDIRIDLMVRENTQLKSDLGSKVDAMGLLNAQVQQLSAEVLSNENAAQVVKQLESVNAKQLGENSGLLSLISTLQEKISQLQSELTAKRNELESQIKFNTEIINKKQNLAKELDSYKILEKDLRSQEAASKNELLEMSKKYESKIEKLSGELKLMEHNFHDALRKNTEMQKENTELRELNHKLEQDLETNMMKPRSHGGSLADMHMPTLTIRSSMLPPEYEARIAEQKLVVDKLSETLTQVIRTNALEAKFQQAKIDQLSMEVSSRNVHSVSSE